MRIKDLLKKDNPFDYVVLGFIMKLLGDVAGFFISYHIADSVFGVISWILIIKGFTKIPGSLKFQFRGFYKTLLYFFFFQCLVMIVRGYTIDYEYVWFTTIGAINYHLFQPTYILCYLMPFTALIPLRYYNFRLIANYSIVFIIITVVLSVVNFNEIMKSSLLMAAGMDLDENNRKATDVLFYGAFAFLSLLYCYLPYKKWKFNLIGLTITVLFLIIGARRGGVLLYSFLLIGAVYFRAIAKSGLSRIATFLISALLLAIAAYFILQSVMSTYLMERGFEDSRSDVEDAMFRQMSITDCIFGKGLNGRYYCPLNIDGDYLNGWRYGVETGFYNLVLKGGYLLAITYVLLLAIPAYRGLFKSKNLFCKAGGFYIVHSLISLWPFGLLQFRLNFFIIWIMIVCCMNKRVLSMYDNEIKERFFYKLK